MDPQVTLDPLVRAVYLMYRSDAQFRPFSVDKLVSPPPKPTTSAKRPTADTLFLELGSALDALKRGRDTIINELKLESKQRQLLKQSLIMFSKNYNTAQHRDLAEILSMFHLAAAKTLQMADPLEASHHFVYLVHFVDVLLLLKCSQEQRNRLLSERAKFCSIQITPPMNVQELSKFQWVATTYNVPLQEITNQVLAFKGTFRESDLNEELERKKSYYRYKESDFEQVQHYNEWRNGRESFLERATKRPRQNTKSSKSTPRQVSPTSPYICLDAILDIVLRSKSGMNGIAIETLKDCLFVWQLDGYEVFISVIKAFSRVATDKRSLNSARKTAKTLLEFCCLSYKPESWPTPIKQQLYLFDRINKPILENVLQELLDLFNTESLGKVLIGLIQISNNSLLGVSGSIKEKFEAQLTSSVKQRYLAKLKLVPSGRDVSYNDIFKLLESVVEDLIYLNSTVLREFEKRHGDMWKISQPLKHYLAKHAFLDARNIVRFMTGGGASFNPVSGRYVRKLKYIDSSADIGLILDDLTAVKDLSQYPPSNFSELVESFFYPDYYNRCVDWCSELTQHCQTAIKADDYQNMDSVGYSKSVGDLFALFEKYLSDLSSLHWHNTSQNATMHTLLYEAISANLNTYADLLTREIMSDLLGQSGLNTQIGPTYVKINNLYAVLEKLDTIFKDDVLDGFSKEMTKKTGASRQSNKLISLKVLNAENVEDSKSGRELSSFLRLTGIIENRTRTIVRDAYPEWDEEFETVIKGRSSTQLQLRIFNEISPKEARVFQSFQCDLRLDSDKEGLEQKVKFKDDSGASSLRLSYSFETIRNDPVFFIGRTRTTLLRFTQRITQLLVSKFTESVKMLFTKEALAAVSIEQPIFHSIEDFLALKDNPEQIRDGAIVELCTGLNSIIATLSSFLEPKAVDQLVLNTWCVVVTRATALLLPPLSSIKSHQIKRQQSSLQQKNIFDRLSSTVKNLNLNSQNDTTLTTKDAERAVSWVYKLYFMIKLNLPDPLHPKLNSFEFHQFLQVRLLYHKELRELQGEYENALLQCEELWLSRMESNNGDSSLRRSATVMHQATRKRRLREDEVKIHERERNACFTNREIVLRVILAKLGGKGVDYIQKKMDDFTKISREMENRIKARMLIKRR